MATSRAVLTMVHDESVFLPIWLRYYGRNFAPEDMYVLDHNTTDGSTDVGGFVREPVDHDGVDHTWMRDTIQARQHELLERYDAVLITDVDEIVAPHPSDGTLAEYIDGLKDDFVNCNGYEIVQHRDETQPIDLSRPVLSQRGWWFSSFTYRKPLLAREPMRWVAGFHARLDGAYNLDPQLYLIHLHRMDYETTLARHRIRLGMKWGERDIRYNRAGHNRITEQEEFDRWFFEDSNTQQPMVLEPIPPEWSDVV